MTNNFIFIEEGSIDVENTRKVLDNCGNADVKFITYKQGAAKPELVSIQTNTVDLSEKITKETREKILDALAIFLDKNTDKTVERDVVYGPYSVMYRTTYSGTVDDLMNAFEKFLKEDFKG